MNWPHHPTIWASCLQVAQLSSGLQGTRWKPSAAPMALSRQFRAPFCRSESVGPPRARSARLSASCEASGLARLLLPSPAAASPLPPSPGWSRPPAPTASGLFPVKMNGTTPDGRSPPPSARQTGSPLRAGRGQASGFFVSAVPPPGARWSRSESTAAGCAPLGSAHQKEPGATREVGVGWGGPSACRWAGRRSPRFTHTTQSAPPCRPLAPRPLPGAASFALFQEATPQPPIQGPPQGGLHLPTLAGLDVNLTRSPSSATHPEVRGAYEREGASVCDTWRGGALPLPAGTVPVFQPAALGRREEGN